MTPYALPPTSLLAYSPPIPYTVPVFDTFLPERTLVTFGALAIYWYGLLAALGALAAFRLGQSLAKRITLTRDAFGDAFFLTLLLAMVGARLWHVVGDFGYYRYHLMEIPAIWNGGLALHGGVVGGGLALWWYAKRTGRSFLLLADLFAPLAALAHGIARWGNYFNQELFGRPTTLPWGIPIAPSLRPPTFATATHFHPVFLYESLGLLLITTLLVMVFRSRGREKAQPWDTPGSLLAWYLVLSGVLRIGMEFLRVEPVLSIQGIRVPLLVSITLVLVGLLLFWKLFRQPHRSPSAS